MYVCGLICIQLDMAVTECTRHGLFSSLPLPLSRPLSYNREVIIHCGLLLFPVWHVRRSSMGRR